jgi:hypothetical protein
VPLPINYFPDVKVDKPVPPYETDKVPEAVLLTFELVLLAPEPF